ncbi:hypothetical protein [Longimicrobium terrae]|uniref:Uncharacterized protein n=1 Tax=Longimicrobium terrae TaxID=1639882 RepID=A0A841GUQ2_9BACT|nr:hypothetical protein [Longimicrobium terrae]MBB4634327.1 hypothetical protein [Longimicrobium terrae]MBB6068783.1 hypothetical protein [Longimicrobium terrae]NNC27967.1 hypothetical protein [Longimicrobium terrae]
MGNEYTFAVASRYVLLLLPGVAAAFCHVPLAWQDVLVYGVMACAVLFVHTMPAARFARRAPEPWAGWMAAHAARAHSFGGVGVLICAAILDRVPQEIPGEPGGMQIQKLWVEEGPSLLSLCTGIGIYTLLSVCWALMAGAVARRIGGVMEPEPDVHRFRIRRPRLDHPA